MLRCRSLLLLLLLTIYRLESNRSNTPPPLPPMSVHLFPRDPEHTDRERRGSQRVETVATFKFPTTDSWARHDKTLFPSAERICYLAAGAPSDFCGVHFRRLLRQHRGAFIFGGGETSRQHGASPGDSVFSWKLCPRSTNLSSVQGIYDEVGINIGNVKL